MYKLLVFSPPASSPSQASPEPPTITVIGTQNQLHDQPHDESVPRHQSHDQSPDHSLDQLPTQSHDEMLLNPADSHSSEIPPRDTGAERADAEGTVELAAPEMEETEEERLVKKWSKILGPEYIVKVSSFVMSL